MGSAIRLCQLADIADGDSKGFDPLGQGRDLFFVVRQGERVFAWRNRCPHKGYEGAKMAWKRDRYLSGDGLHIFCAAHGARFEIDSGLCVTGPCLHQSLSPVAVSVDASGDLYWIPEKEQ